MSEPGKGGRPRIGQAVTTTLPAEVLVAVDETAAREGTSRADVLRATITDAFAQVDKDTGVANLLAPAITIICDWIAADPDLSRERFIAYRRVAGVGRPVVNLLTQITGELIMAGVPVTPPPPEIVNVLTSRMWKGQQGWRLRGDMFLHVVAELQRRGVRMPPAADGGDSGRTLIEFLEDEEEDYA